MDNYQIIHFNHPLEVNKLSFLDIGKNLSAVDEDLSQKAFTDEYADLIQSKLKTVLKMADDNKSPLVFFSLPFLKFLQIPLVPS